MKKVKMESLKSWTYTASGEQVVSVLTKKL